MRHAAMVLSLAWVSGGCSGQEEAQIAAEPGLQADLILVAERWVSAADTALGQHANLRTYALEIDIGQDGSRSIKVQVGRELLVESPVSNAPNHLRAPAATFLPWHAKGQIHLVEFNVEIGRRRQAITGCVIAERVGYQRAHDVRGCG